MKDKNLSRTLRLAVLAGLVFAPTTAGVLAAPAATKPATTTATAPASAPSAADLLPKCGQPDWKVELLAKVPDIHYPSVVTCAPDGRVFMAEDPADMPGPSNKEIDRILCFHPDGRRTVFAENLHAVYGLQYIDGKVYVHHTPKLSVFTDDNGVGKDRVDLIDTTNPNPNNGGGGFNDHIPANIRLGMDGFLYMATGDKGIYNAESNVDHRKAEIKGGGVLRIRPDGTDMEAYSTGTRNHLDVSINAEDEIFTYDNTDDGIGWWTRLTHMVDGGFYGYPYDYRPHPADAPALEKWKAEKEHSRPWQPYTLWRAEEYAGGSPTGATGYNEDALPDEYRGNLFHCEWGKGAIERFVVQREGGSYKVVKRVADFLKGGKEPFRPVGITVLADGTGLLVTDWNYNGWMNKTESGRLFKLTYTGKSQAAPKPAWFVPAGQGQPFVASTGDLIAGLSHPAQSVRLVAQRRVAERGAEAVGPLAALLKDAKAPAYAKWSAIWTLDRIEAADGGKGAKGSREAIIAVVKDDRADASVRMQAARQLGTRRAKEAAQPLATLLDSPDEALRFRAAAALGRIGEASAVPALLAKLNDKDLFAHYAVFTALNRIGRADPAAWKGIVSGLAHDATEVREGVVLAVRETYDEALAKALADFAADAQNPTEGRAAALAALAPLSKQAKPWDGKWWGTQPRNGYPPAHDVEWAGTAPVAAALKAGLQDANTAVKLAAVAGLQVAPDPTTADALMQLFRADKSTAIRKAVLKALAASKAAGSEDLVAGLLKDPAANAELLGDAVDAAEKIGGAKMADALTGLVSGAGVAGEQLVAAIDALGKLHDAKSVPALAKRLGDGDAKTAAAAAAALGAVSGDEAVAALAPGSSDKRAEVRKAVVNALGSALSTASLKPGTQKPSGTPKRFDQGALTVTRPEAAITPLLAAARDPETEKEAILALSAFPDVRALDAYLEGLASKDGGVRDRARKAVVAVRGDALPLIEQRLDTNPLPTQALSELQRIYATPTAILDWQIIGPFANPTPEPFAVDAPPAAEQQYPGLDGKPVKWKKEKAEAKQGRIDLSSKLNPNSNVTAYAAATVESDSDRETAFAMGADDGLVLWLNGKKIFEDLNDHGWQPEAFAAKGTLKKGKNLLVAKITQHGGPWEFSVAVGVPHQGKLFSYDTRSLSPEAFGAYAAAHPGNAANGKKIFEAPNGVGCVKCHKVAESGADVGPSLGGVGSKYPRQFLVESVLYPSKQILNGFEQTVIKTKKGRIEQGLARNETETELTLIDSSGEKKVIKKSEIETRKLSPLSLMPEGLHAALKPEEFADLIAYVESLKDKPAEPRK